jgi:hypothetical protein
VRKDGKSPYVSPYIARSQAEALLVWIDRQGSAPKNRDVRAAIDNLRRTLARNSYR